MDESLRQLLMLGKEYYQKHDYPSARAYLEQVVEKSEAFADVYNMLGVIYHDAGQFTKAESAFEHALKINPAYTEAALNLAVLYNDVGKYGEAKQTYVRALEKSRRAPGALDGHVAGKIANMHADVGDAYRSAGRLKEAVTEYRKAVELGPTFVDIRVKLAATLRDAGQLDTAVAELSRALADRPQYVPARIQLGVCLYSMQKPQEAMAQWNEVLKQDPTNDSAAMYIKLVAGDGPKKSPKKKP